MPKSAATTIRCGWITTMSNHVLRTISLALVGFAATLLLLWALPPTSPLTSSFSVGSLYTDESTAFLGRYHWTTPQGEIRIPLRWWTRTVIVRQRLSAGPVTRPLTLQSPAGVLRFGVAADTMRTYHYLMPTRGGWLTASFAIADVGPLAGDPRALGLIVSDSQVVYLADTLYWPGLALLLLALCLPLAERVGAAWRMGPWRWAVAFAFTSAVLFSYHADGLQTLTLGPTLLLGLGVVGGGGWVLGRLRGELGTWHGLVLALSMGFALVPLVLIVVGFGPMLPSAWPLLIMPLLLSVIVSLLPGNNLYRPIFALVAAISSLTWAGWYDYPDALLRFPSDFQAYYDAAQRLLNNQPLYDLATLSSNPFATTYKYPPITALLISPLTLLPLSTAGLVWRGMCIVGAVVGVVTVRTTYPQAQRPALTLIALALLVALSPVSRSLRFGQPELLILAGAVLGSALLLRGRIWSSAAIWALIALAKIYPLLLVIPLLMRGRGRWIVAFATCLVGWTALSSLFGGWDIIFWRDLFPSLGSRDGRLSNLAIYGVIARLIEPAAYSGKVDVPAALLPALLLGGILYFWAALLIWQRRTTLNRQFWDALSLMVCTILLVIPVAWDHYHALLLLPLGVSLGVLGQNRDEAPLWFAAYSLVIFGVSRDIWPIGDTVPGVLPLFFASYRTIGVLLLWIWFARRLTSPPANEIAL